jgi:hypothetical protein
MAPRSPRKDVTGKTSASMPSLIRFLFVLGLIAGVVTGSLYVLAEFFQPEPKEISKALRNVKAREEAIALPVPVPAPVPDASAPGTVGSTSQGADRTP